MSRSGAPWPEASAPLASGGAAATPAVEATGLALGWPGRELMASIDLRLEWGSLVALLGANGAGKSTLLRTLAGLQAPLAGTVQVAGEVLEKLPPRSRARLLAWVGSARARPLAMRGRELVALGRYPHSGWDGRLGERDRQAVDQALADLDASSLAERQVAELSDGELQKLALARALAQQARVLLVDEPTSHLDIRRRLELGRCLADLAHRRGSAVVVATHDLDLALGLADQLIVLEAGRFSVGAPEDLALAGVLDRALGGGGLRLDPLSGSFATATPIRERIRLVGGTPERRAWTSRALLRVGVGVDDRAERELVVGGHGWILPDGEPAARLAEVTAHLAESGTGGGAAESNQP